MLIVCSPTVFLSVFDLFSLILHPHPPLLFSILMAGLGGLTCLVIDGNVSGSHFPRQHPAAFHQAWCRGEPITWTLLTLCSLAARLLSDPSTSDASSRRHVTLHQCNGNHQHSHHSREKWSRGKKKKKIKTVAEKNLKRKKKTGHLEVDLPSSP